MEVLLLQDIPGIGKKSDLLVVGDGFALNYLLPRRAALVATPLVRKRYADFIRRRAEEKAMEQAAHAHTNEALNGKTLSFKRKATKTGKLYAAITPANLSASILEHFGVAVPEDAIVLDEQIKSIGSHAFRVSLGNGTPTMTAVVEREQE